MNYSGSLLIESTVCGCGELTFSFKVFSYQRCYMHITHGSLNESYTKTEDFQMVQKWLTVCIGKDRIWVSLNLKVCVHTSDRSPFLTWMRAMLSSQVLRSSGVLAYDLARLYCRSTSISGSRSCSFIWAVAIRTVRIRFVKSFTSDGNAVFYKRAPSLANLSYYKNQSLIELLMYLFMWALAR